MTGTKWTLLGILAFVALTVGTFIWFIASWDRHKEEAVTSAPVSITNAERTT